MLLSCTSRIYLYLLACLRLWFCLDESVSLRPSVSSDAIVRPIDTLISVLFFFPFLIPLGQFCLAIGALTRVHSRLTLTFPPRLFGKFPLWHDTLERLGPVSFLDPVDDDLNDLLQRGTEEEEQFELPFSQQEGKKQNFQN